MAIELPHYQYRVDADDKIVWLNSLWLGFARENDAVGLIEESVLGRSIWDFVAGDVTRKLYLEVHSRVRSSGKPAVLPFRCDSPSLQRQMRLTITSEDTGQLMYDSVLVGTKPQRSLRVLDPAQPRSKSFLTMCSCFKRILLEPAGWLDVLEIAIKLRLLEAQEAPEIRYTMCPDCDDTMQNGSNNGNAA